MSDGSSSRPVGRSFRSGVPLLAVVLLAGVTALVGSPVGAAGAASVGSADLGVTISSSQRVIAGQVPVEIKVEVTNAGPDAATDIVVIDRIYDVGYLDESKPATTTVGTCANNYGGLVCRMPKLSPGATATITASVRFYEFGPISTTVAAVAAQTDPNPSNDLATLSVVVVPGPSFEDRAIAGYFPALLGRKATNAEVVEWTAVLQQQGFDAFVRRLLATTAYRSAWVDAAFRRYLGRPSGPNSTYLRWLQAGRSYDDVVVALVSSGEFASHAGPPCPSAGPCPMRTLTRTAWVEAAYKALTGDALSARAAAAYQDRIDAGASRSTIAAEIVRGPDARRRFVDSIIRQRFGRPASNYDLYINVSELLRGVRPQAVEGSILASYSATQVLIDPAEAGPFLVID